MENQKSVESLENTPILANPVSCTPFFDNSSEQNDKSLGEASKQKTESNAIKQSEHGKQKLAKAKFSEKSVH